MRTESEIQRLIERRFGRRALLRGAGLIAAGVALPREAEAARGFETIPLTFDERHHVAAGYRADILVSWGDPVVGPEATYDHEKQSPARQAKQFGYNNDFTAYLPIDGSKRGLLCVNHEYTDPQLMWPGMTRRNAVEHVTELQARTEMEAQGHTVVEVVRAGRRWRVEPRGKYNRRITATTPCLVTGPAAGHARMRTKEDPSGRRVIGTFANCSGGITPWGTILSAEENTDFYFIGKPSAEKANHARYGVGKTTFFAWHKWERRFRLDETPNEPNRHGWIVEIDPFDPTRPPIKRTALGRFAHESGTVTLSHDGRVVVYSGDDKRFEYLYRYVSKDRYDPARPNPRLLDDGVLSAAKFFEDGTVEWRPLVHGEGPLTAKNGFFSQADVVIEARRAADLVGATKMDRPEDVGVHPQNGRVYVALANNDRRTVTDAANPRANNIHGHILELLPAAKAGGWDHTARVMKWDVFLLGQKPKAPPPFALAGARLSLLPSFTSDHVLSSPDNFAFDARGRMWITTDGQDKSGFADSIYMTETTGRGRAKVRRFFNAPRGAEVTGPSFTPDGRTMFLAVQHPAQERTSTFDGPSTRWPDFEDDAPPRPSVLAITHEDGGIIGD